MTDIIAIEELTLHYPGAPKPTLGGVGFAVAPGEFVSVVGPSGAGKTTLLNCISGLMAPTSGRVLLEGEAIQGPSRKIAIVFQDYSRSLFPWMSAEKNVALPLTSRGLSSAQIAERVESALASVGLGGQGAKYPWEMSGGMQQRVAIARALALEPHVLIMDEPMASVDAQTRSDLEDLVLRIWAERKVTVILVTHDIDEAVYMSDRVIVLSTPPTTVHSVMEIDLPRPRNQLTTKDDPSFAHQRARLFTEIKELRTRTTGTTP
jgi:NitT/TauT family transport system ATP-binding protein